LSLLIRLFYILSVDPQIIFEFCHVNAYWLISSRLAIPPLALCFGIGTLIGSGAIAATGVLYGMQIVGKK
jgi:hypothetical protein